MKKLGAAAAFACVLLLSACESEKNPSAMPLANSTPDVIASESGFPSSTARPRRNVPPPVMVIGDTTAELAAWSYCYGNRCVSGAPPANPPDVGRPDQVKVYFPLPDWTFDAYFQPADEKCGRTQRVPLDPAGDGMFLLDPAGFAGTYDVTLFARGESSLSATFRWTTPVDGPLPEPRARLAILSSEGGGGTSYGVELEVSNLESTPKSARARITVTAKGGESIAFSAGLSPRRCFPEGTLYFDRPDDEGSAAAQLGDRPFTYEVTLILDGNRYRARAVWPEDQIPGNHPSVGLNFSPPLPALSK